MKKILFSINNLQGGGAEKLLIDVVQNLNSRYKIDILLIEKEGVYIEEIKNSNQIISIFGKRKKWNKIKILRKINTAYRIFYIKFFYKYIIKNKIADKYDVIIPFLEGVTTELFSKLKSTSIISWVHTDLNNVNTHFSRSEEKKMYENSNKIVCVSDQIKKSFIKRHPYYQNKVIVIKNLIDTEKIKVKSLESKKEINVGIKEYNKIVSVGRLSIEKGHNILLEAINNLVKKGIKVQVDILGIGNKYGEYSNYIQENKLENNINLLGFKKNPYPYIKDADIFILPSYVEGYPLVLCEAMVLGKCIISSNTLGGEEILENGKYGLLFEKGQAKDLEKVILKVLGNKEKILEYSEKVKIGAKKFKKEIIINEIIKIIEEQSDKNEGI